MATRSSDTRKSRKSKFATCDDRFTFPPLPGYTGYIPRCREHFGKSYTMTTSAALADFEQLSDQRAHLPQKLDYVCSQSTKAWSAGRSPVIATSSTTMAASPASATSVSSSDSKRSYKSLLHKHYDQPDENERQSFISGYTGFIPHLRNRFGHQYQNSASEAMEEFRIETLHKEAENEDMSQVHPFVSHPELATSPVAATTSSRASSPTSPRSAGSAASPSSSKSGARPAPTATLEPIPGYTGFVALTKYSYSQTYGQSIRNHVSHADIEQASSESRMPKKDLAKTLPIPGYRGFVPLYQMTGEKSYGQTSKRCILAYKEMVKNSEH
ncbi:hypothetical protein RI367_003278 [Sorochytrium milnesiophthora]